MALFGAPKAQEDDAGKAVAAALAMHHALEDLTAQLTDRLGHGLSMRIGINTGLVVTGAVGPGGYTVTGDAVNVAARLEKAAEPGAVLVGETTRRLARRQFRWGERQEFAVKGRAEPVACYTVETLAPARYRAGPRAERDALRRSRAVLAAYTGVMVRDQSGAGARAARRRRGRRRQDETAGASFRDGRGISSAGPLHARGYATSDVRTAVAAASFPAGEPDAEFPRTAGGAGARPRARGSA